MCCRFGMTTSRHRIWMTSEVKGRDPWRWTDPAARVRRWNPHRRKTPNKDSDSRKEVAHLSSWPRVVTKSGTFSKPDAWQRQLLALPLARLLQRRKEGRSRREARVTAGECELTKLFQKVAPLTLCRPLHPAGRTEQVLGIRLVTLGQAISQRENSSHSLPPPLSATAAATCNT